MLAEKDGLRENHNDSASEQQSGRDNDCPCKRYAKLFGPEHIPPYPASERALAADFMRNVKVYYKVSDAMDRLTLGLVCVAFALCAKIALEIWLRGE